MGRAAGIIHQHIESAELFGDGCHAGLDLLVVAHIAGAEHCLAPGVGRQVLRVGAAAHDHLSAGGQKRLGDAPAYALTAAGNEDDLIAKIQRIAHLFRLRSPQLRSGLWSAGDLLKMPRPRPS